MSTHDALERELATWMADDPLGTPDDAAFALIVTATGRRRPRPRWLAILKEPPMRIHSSVAVGSPTLRLATISLLTMLLIAALAAAAVAGASLLPSPRHAPPYGPAANGLVAFERSGDIWVADEPTQAPARLLIGGAADDSLPTFSRDGTRLSFERVVPGEPGRVMVANADGTGIVAIAESTGQLDAFDWSPDARHMAMLWTVQDRPVISIVSTDGSEPQVNLGLPGLTPAAYVAWLPPDGERLVFVAHEGTVDSGREVFTVRPDGSDLRRITDTEDCLGGFCFQDADVSPLGDWLAFWNWEPRSTGTGAYLHVLDLVTGEDRLAQLDRSDGMGVSPRFSPDGRSLLFDGGPRRPGEDIQGATGQLVLAPLDGSTPARPMGPAYVSNVQHAHFSPDGAHVLQDVDDRTRLIDVATGDSVQAPEYLGPTSWQRLAP